MKQALLTCAMLGTAIVLMTSNAFAQADTEPRHAAHARRELIGRVFELVETKIFVNRVTILSQRKLRRAGELSTGAAQELIAGALKEIEAIPQIKAVCSKQQLKENLAYRGESMMHEDFGFYFKPSRKDRCTELSMRDVQMQPLEFDGQTLKLKLTIDENIIRTATCQLVSADGPFSLWQNVTAGCTLPQGEGSFTLAID